MTMIRQFGLALATILLMAGYAHSQPAMQGLSGHMIMAEAAAHHGGDDGTARVTFHITAPNREDATLVYKMAWKHLHTGRYSAKVLFFPEAPADLKGKTYMGFIAPPGSKHANEEWIYLPELKAVRKLTHKNHNGAEDLFAHSVLTEADLSPRPPGLDTHTLLRTERANGLIHHIVESIPKAADPGYSYAKVVTRVTPIDYLPVAAEYFDAQGNRIKHVSRKWKKVGGVWVWDRVTAVEDATGARTELIQSDIKINLGLSDKVFSQRTMKRGPDRLF